VANSALLFWWLRGLTGARWRCFFVAALFAIHPLHVQSVAWISERKDVLSGFFFMLTLLSYTRYCRDSSTGNYLLVTASLALGLMAKPMLVTVPFVLLLLDFWPLQRFPPSAFCPPPRSLDVGCWMLDVGCSPSALRSPLFRRLLMEKLPLFLLSLASCLVTLWAQHSGGAMVSMQATPLWGRFLHAVVAYSLYLGKIFYPVDLAIYYPLSFANPDALAVLGSLFLLVILWFAAIRRRPARPWLLAGWAWFFVMLLPVIGVVQVGLQSMADRYAYLPSIGLFIAVVWGLADVAARSIAWRVFVAGLGAACLLACGLDTRYQLGFWRNNITLFQHVVDVSPKNDYLGYFYLGISYGELGELDAAARCLTSALDAKPDFETARSRLGNVLLLQKNYAAAEPLLAAQAQIHPDNFPARVTLGMALAGEGKYAAAQSEFQAALQLNPNEPTVNRLFAANAPKADAELALNALLGVLATNATPEIRVRGAQAMSVLGRYAEAAQQYRLALAQAPDSVEGLNNLAWLLATCPDGAVRNGPEAVALAQHACELTQYQRTVLLGTLAAACAEAGQFDAAVHNAQKACDHAAAAGETGLLELNRRLLALYQSRQPYRDLGP
jgi:tetratricopeptide (TPR) repeat protein